MAKIIEHWKREDPDWTRSWHIGWGEPFCFACGWLAPVPSNRKQSWQTANKWLDIAHLKDHFEGGPEEPFNLVPMCHLCHQAMPPFADRDAALEWVKARPLRCGYWQLYTDCHLWGKSNVTRNSTILAARTRYLEIMLEHAQSVG